ncbi:MAG: PEP-CTERM sorting domain-containing protein [Luteimonas sp.]|nr:PEP-CTERM sorting domain-containing protein [Luteimonas sp.]
MFRKFCLAMLLTVGCLSGASAQVRYSFEGYWYRDLRNDAYGPLRFDMAFSYLAPDFVQRLTPTYLYAEALESCTSTLEVCVSVGLVPNGSGGPEWDGYNTSGFDEVGFGGMFYSFPDEALSNPGTYASIPNTYSVSGGTLTVTQVPEPSTYALLVAGLGVLGWHVRRRRSL